MYIERKGIKNKFKYTTIATKFQSFTHQRCLFHRFAVSRFHHSQLLPIANQDLSVCYGEQRRYMSPSIPQLLPHRVPKSKPRFHLFTFGKAEVRVAFNDRAERYHSRNLVTERDVISLCDHVTERAVTEREFMICVQVTIEIPIHLLDD